MTEAADATRDAAVTAPAMLGRAAMLLWYDIVPEHVAEHDEWHTREHFPERVGIPGFLRAQRWVAGASTSPRYLVSYEVSDVGVLTSAAYEARLNAPSRWTQRMMPRFRGMVRGFCRQLDSVGGVLGTELLSVRYAPQPGRRESPRRWLAEEALPSIAARAGFASAVVLGAAAAPPMTAEQALRGRDATVDGVLLVTAYAPDLVDELRAGMLAAPAWEAAGAAPGVEIGAYRLACRADAASVAEPRARAANDDHARHA